MLVHVEEQVDEPDDSIVAHVVPLERVLEQEPGGGDDHLVAGERFVDGLAVDYPPHQELRLGELANELVHGEGPHLGLGTLRVLVDARKIGEILPV